MANTVSDMVADLKGLPTREELVKLLSEELVEVTFNKLDGDERVMTCTLQESVLPNANRDDKLSQTKVRNLEDKVVVVWDTKATGFRSFRYDRVTKVEIVNKGNL